MKFVRAILVLLLATPGWGSDVVLDGFSPTAPFERLDPIANTIAVTEGLGRRAGTNLFHSFAQFDLSATDTAVFSGDPAIRSIISRVTGGDVSDINGIIQSTIAGASFWFLNPAGIVMGPDARIDATGTIALGASDFLVLADGQLFGVQTTEADVALLVAEPQSFGFLDASTAGNLVLNGSELVQETSGDLVLQGTNVALDNGATLITRTEDADDAGAIRITATSSITSNNSAGAPVLENAPTVIKSESLNATSGSTGAITLGADTVQLARTEIRSTTASNQAADNVASPIAISGTTRLSMTDVDVSSTTSAATASGRIGLDGGAIEINGRLTEVGPAGGVETFTTGPGNAGSIDVTGRSISLLDGAKLSSISGVFQVTGTTGNSGAITLTASDSIVGNQGLPAAGQVMIFSGANTANAGAVGSVALTAANIDLTNALVNAQTDSSLGGDSNGDAVIDARDRGSVAIVATQALTLTDVQAETNTSRAIDAGDLTLSAGGAVTISNPGPTKRRIRTATGGAGDAGDIHILGDSITLSGDIVVAAATGLGITDPDGTLRPITPTGDAGDITIRATGAVRGNPGVASTAPVLEIESESRTPVSGAAGRVTIEGGSVELTTTRVSALNRSDVLSAPGAVDITAAAELNLTNVDVTTLSTGPSPAGSISIAGGAVDIAGVRVNGIDSLTRGSGNAGDIQIAGQTIVLRDGARVSARAAGGGGAAGRITLEGSAIDLSNSRVTATTGSPVAGDTNGDGLINDDDLGSIEVTGSGTVSLRDVNIETTTSNSAHAGNISVSGSTVNLVDTGVNSSPTIRTATSGEGDAGDVEIRGDRITLQGGVEVVAVSGFQQIDGPGRAGTVTISANDSIVARGDLEDGIEIRSESRTANSGPAGRINIEAESVDVANTFVIASTKTDRTDGIGAIDITGTRELTLTDTNITTSTEGRASAGDITLSGATVAVTGRLGTVNDDGTPTGGIQATTRGIGNAGNLRITGETIDINDGARLVVTTGPRIDRAGNERPNQPSGDAGNIEITATDAIRFNQGLPAAERVEVATAGKSPGAGAAGSIALSAPVVDLQLVSVTATTDSGRARDAGAVDITGATGVNLTNVDVITLTTGRSSAGSISITGQTIAFSDGVRVSARAEDGGGAAGRITLEGSAIDLSNSSVIATTDSPVAGDTNGDGLINDDDLGSIEITGSATISLRDVNIETSTSNAAHAGNVSVSGGTVSIAQTGVTGSPTIRAATSGAGNAGNVEVVGESISLTGDVEIVAVSGFRQSTQPGSAGSVTLRASGAIEARGTAEDPMLIRSESRTATSGPAGRVTIEGASVDLSLLSIISTTLTDRTDGIASVAISGTDRVKLSETDITTTTRGMASAGNITLTGGAVEITSRLNKLDDFGNPSGGIQATSSGLGNAGNVQISGESIDLNEGARIVASTGPRRDRDNTIRPEAPTGDGGTIALTATGAVRTNSGLTSPDIVSIGGASNGVGAGAAGRINLVGDSVDLRATRMTTRTERAVDGAASTISVQAANDVAFTDVEVSASTNGGTDAGHILIEGSSFAMTGGSLESSTTGIADAGRISIGRDTDDFGNVTAAMSGPITVSNARTDAQNALQPLEGQLRANAGSIDIRSNDLVTVTGTVSSSAGIEAGSAGRIDLVGNGVTMSNGLLSTSTGSSLATATRATIRVDGGTGPITLTNSGMEVSTSGAADAGDILITGGSFTMNGVFAREGDPDGVGIEASTVGTGDAGAIIIAGAIEQPNTGLLRIATVPLDVDIPGFSTTAMSGDVSLNGATIASTTTGQGTSGDIVIDTTGLFQMVTSNVSTSATAAGDGGNINLSIGSGIIRSRSLIQTTAQQGNGGVININVVGEDQLFLIDTESLISAASDEGTSGTVTVTAPDTDIDAAITPQDARIVQDVRLAADACTRAARAIQNSFVVEDRGGLAPSPNDYLVAGALYSSDEAMTFVPQPDATVAMQGCR